jgi:exodeoxyribonuclease VIII
MLTEDELIAAGPHTRQMPNQEYHDGPGVSNSMLRWVHMSPAMLKWSLDAPTDDEADAATDIGSALHTLLLEPNQFDAEYVRDFEPPMDAISTVDQIKAALDAREIAYKASAGKQSLTHTLLTADPQAPVVDALRGEWEKGTDGRIVLGRADWRKLHLMRDSVMAHPTARQLLTLPGETERCHYWVDEDTGELCRCRIDREIPSLGMIADIKTTGLMKWFDRSIEDYGYHVQEEWYREGWKQTQGREIQAFAFIVVSTVLDRRRYMVDVKEIEPGSRDIARMEMRADLQAYSNARKSDDWISITTAGLPYRKGY